MDINCTWSLDGVAELHYTLTDAPAAESVRFQSCGISDQLCRWHHPALTAVLSAFAPCRLTLLFGVCATLSPLHLLEDQPFLMRQRPPLPLNTLLAVRSAVEHQDSPPAL